jgi:hypothetical protein
MLETIRLADLARPERLGYVVLPDEILDLAVVRIASTGQAYAYVAAGQGGLCIVDVSDPARPVLVGTHDLSSHVSSVAVYGDDLYVSAGALHLMDLAAPAAPVEIGTYVSVEQMGTAGKLVAVSDGYAYAIYDGGSSGTGDLRIIDLSEPFTPFEAGTYRAGAPVRDAAVVGDHAYLLVGRDAPYLVIVNTSDPLTPIPVDPARVGTWSGQRLAVAAHKLYLVSPGPADARGALQILDVTDPTHPVALGRYEDIPSPAGEIVAQQDKVFLAASGELVVIDASDPHQPAVAGSYEPHGLPGTTRGLAAAGDHIYVAAGRDGLSIVGVSDPGNPRVVGRLDMPGYAWNVAPWAGHAYIAAEDAGLRVIDVRDPTAPVEVGHHDPAGRPAFYSDIAIAAGRPGPASDSSAGRAYAYVADAIPEDTSLRIIDISDPADPREASRLPLAVGIAGDVRAYGVVVSGDYAYLAVGAAGLRVVDISDPSAPVEVGAYDVPGRADNLAVAGDRVYLIDGDLRILDVSDPTAPREVGFYDVPDLSPWPHVAVEGHYAYLTAQETIVLDVSSPGTPVEVARYPLARGDIALGNGLLYVTGDGLSILRPSAPATPVASPTSTPGDACSTHTAAMSIWAQETDLDVGETLTVTATLTNQGCGSLGLPQYTLHVEMDGSEPVFSTLPEPVVHYLGIATGHSDTVQFALRAIGPGQTTLNVSASFEFHAGYPGLAWWTSASSGPLHITVQPSETEP